MPDNWIRWFRRPTGRPIRRGRGGVVEVKREREILELTERVRELEECNRKLESVNRIQQVEIDELTAVVARNLERVKAETRILAKPVSERSALARAFSNDEELEGHA